MNGRQRRPPAPRASRRRGVWGWVWLVLFWVVFFALLAALGRVAWGMEQTQRTVPGYQLQDRSLDELVIAVGEYAAILAAFAPFVWAAGEGLHQGWGLKEVRVRAVLGAVVGPMIRLGMGPVPDNIGPRWLDYAATFGFASIAGLAICTGGAQIFERYLGQRIRGLVRRKDEGEGPGPP